MPWSRMHSENVNAAASASSAADPLSLEFVEPSPPPIARTASPAIPSTSTTTAIPPPKTRLRVRNPHQPSRSLPFASRIVLLLPLVPEVPSKRSYRGEGFSKVSMRPESRRKSYRTNSNIDRSALSSRPIAKAPGFRVARMSVAGPESVGLASECHPRCRISNTSPARRWNLAGAEATRSRARRDAGDDRLGAAHVCSGQVGTPYEPYGPASRFFERPPGRYLSPRRGSRHRLREAQLL